MTKISTYGLDVDSIINFYLDHPILYISTGLQNVFFLTSLNFNILKSPKYKLTVHGSDTIGCL